VEYPSTSVRRMVPACQKFYEAVTEQKVEHDGDPLLARHLSNAAVKIDNYGPRIVKEHRHSLRRIDAAVAGIIALDRALTHTRDRGTATSPAVLHLGKSKWQVSIQIIGALGVSVGVGVSFLTCGNNRCWYPSSSIRN
jgi:phage terminase large subunit-like protein